MVDTASPPAVPNPAGPDGRRSATTAPPVHRVERWASSLPEWMGSIRFRIAAMYSVVLFGLAALMVVGVYAVLSNRLHQEKVYVTYSVELEELPSGRLVPRSETMDRYRGVEHLANERALSLLRTYSLTALGILFVASLGIGWIIAGRVLAPIGRITGVARDISATDRSRRIGLDGPADELKELADTFDAMLDRLDDAFESQQRFIQEASHELRNPLAVIRTNLEVALADPDPDPAELRRVAEVVQGTVERMARLVDDLVVYGRQGSPAHEVEPVDLGRLAQDAAAELEALASTRSLRIQVDAPPEVVVDGDRVALRQAVTNLLDNAVRLAPQGSTVSVSAGRADGEVFVAVADEGPGIREEDRPHVFDRFWRGTDANGRSQGRSGLGLAIVAQVTRDHGGRAELTPNGPGSRFTLRFPV